MRIFPIPLLAVLALAACGTGHEPPPRAPEPRAQSPVIVADPLTHVLGTCVVQNGELSQVRFDYKIQTGDSIYQGVPFSRAFPLDGQYAERAEWFAKGEAIRVGLRATWVKYGLPRELRMDEVTRIDLYGGVGVYAEVGMDAASAEVIYLPVRPGCIFQPYVPVAKLE